MDSPFFRSHWNYPHHSVPRYVPTMSEIPVKRTIKPVDPKVVTIPVRFVESEKTRSDSIAKIQKVIRGFLVRKSVKKIAAIKLEVEEIGMRLTNEETIELIRSNAKERLRFGEMLMSLLLKLDSVKGVDSGVRDLRKAVIKKAIALQEKIDSIVANENENGTLEARIDKTENEHEKDEETLPDSPLSSNEEKIFPENPVGDCNAEELRVPELPESESMEEHTEISEAKSQTDSSVDPPNSAENAEEGEREGEGKEEEREEESRMKVREDEKNRELLERMMGDNRKMMEMMAELFERNESQTRLLSSLASRVGQLEKAFLCDALRRKKKRNVSTTDVSEKTPKTKKCDQ